MHAADHGVVRGADNSIRWEGAAALAAALNGNTTLQTLDLRSMWTARKRVVAGMGSLGEVASSEQQGASGWWLMVGAACASAVSEHRVVRVQATT